MENIERILNNIHCFCQKTSRTLKSMKGYPEIINNPYQYWLNILMEEMQFYTLEASRLFIEDSAGEDLRLCLQNLFTSGFSVEAGFNVFLVTIKLQPENRVVEQLKVQIDNILAELVKLVLRIDSTVFNNKSSS